MARRPSAVFKQGNVELLSLETPIGDEENGHLSDFIEGKAPWRIGSALRMRRAARLVL
jgi:DNA-directed RNA polymerase sigma subunit (sigma70/sigma32)